MTSSTRNSTWLLHAKGYLEVPKLCCTELLDPKRNRMDDDPSAPDGWDMPYLLDLLLPVILFNTKHGIEVLLKTLLLRMDIEELSHHNILSLFDLVEDKLSSIPWVPIKEEHIGESEIVRIQKQVLPELKIQIEYFANNLFVDEKLQTGPIPDPNNELFRYPEMKKNQYPFNFNKLIDQIKDEDISDLKRRIALIERHLLDVGYLISVSKRVHPELFN